MSFLNIQGKRSFNESYLGKFVVNPVTQDCFAYLSGTGLRIFNLISQATNRIQINPQSFGTLGGMDISPNYKLAVLTAESSAYPGGLIDISNPQLPTILYTFSVPANGTVPFFLDNNTYGVISNYSGGTLNNMFVYSTIGNLLQTLNTNLHDSSCGIFNRNNNRLYLLGQSEITAHTIIQVYSYSSNALTLINNLDCGFTANLPQICFNQSQTKLVYGDESGNYALFDLDLKILTNFKNIGLINGGSGSNAISMSANELYVCCQDSDTAQSKIISVKDGSVIYNAATPNSTVTLLPNGGFVAGDFGSPPTYFYYGTYYNPAIVNNGFNASQTGAIKLLNMHRPVSLLGNYKS